MPLLSFYLEATMATWRDLVNQSLKRIGAQALGDSSNFDEAENARLELNALLGIWRNKNLLSYGINEISHTFVANQSTYEIGPTAADIVTTRPMDVKQVVFKYSSIWQPITLIESPEDWNRFNRLETLSIPFPSYFRYLSNVPNGTIEFYPKPSTPYDFKVVVEQPIPQDVSLNDALALPPGYELAFGWGLSANLCAYYSLFDRAQYFESKYKEYIHEIEVQNAKVPLLANELGTIDEHNRTTGYGATTFNSGI